MCHLITKGILEGNSGRGKQNFFGSRAQDSIPPIPREWAREIRTCNVAKGRGQCSQPYGCGGLRRITADSCRFQISARACDNPRQSATAQTNQPAPTGSADRVVEHKGNVRRCLVFSRQRRARSAAYAVAQNRALVGQMFDARSCVKNNTAIAINFTCRRPEMPLSGP